jgi:hypothetical protein
VVVGVEQVDDRPARLQRGVETGEPLLRRRHTGSPPRN